MSSFNSGESPEGVRAEQPHTVERVSFLDQALWKQFNEATTPESFARAWLGLQCRFISGVRQGVVILGQPDDGPFAPVAQWPDESGNPGALSGVAELAMAERRGVVRDLEEEGSIGASKGCHVAFPFLVDDRLFGVVALELAERPRTQRRSVMRQLQWGVGWIEVLLRREQIKGDRAHLDRIATAFDLIAAALEQERFQAACNAIVTELATGLDCDHVSIGFVRRNKTVVVALSHAAQFGRRMNLVRAIAAAMDEAIDQGAMVLFPPAPEWEYRVTRAHEELARALDAGTVLTVPLHSGGRFFGALTFERPHGAEVDEELIELCDCVAGVVGPILEEKRRNDRLVLWKVAESLWTQLKRLLGPRYFGRKLATAAMVALVAVFAVLKDEYRVTSPAVLEGTVQRAIVAPMDGYIDRQYARAGQVLRKGELLASLDVRDLELERLRWVTKRRQHLTEYHRALAARERAEAKVVEAQIEQAEAQIALLDEQLQRARLTAPFDGLVISGDLSQKVGATVQRGDELFRIAPLDSYRVILKIDESDIGDVSEGQEGTLLVSAIPQEPLTYTVERLTPIATAEEGRTYFRVEARLHDANLRLRPGMEGVGKTSVEERLLVWIWTHKLINWARLMIWEWWPS